MSRSVPLNANPKTIILSLFTPRQQFRPHRLITNITAAGQIGIKQLRINQKAMLTLQTTETIDLYELSVTAYFERQKLFMTEHGLSSIEQIDEYCYEHNISPPAPLTFDLPNMVKGDAIEIEWIQLCESINYKPIIGIRGNYLE
jgi:hypothetical protein